MGFFRYSNRGIAGGTGTVTSVDLTMPPIFSVAGAPVTTAGTIAITFTDPGAHRLIGWDNTDNAAVYFTIGTGLTYTQATHTLSASAALAIPANEIVFGTGASVTSNASLRYVSDTLFIGFEDSGATIQVPDATTADTGGGNLRLIGGKALGGNNAGGNVDLIPGLKSGVGIEGVVRIFDTVSNFSATLYTTPMLADRAFNFGNSSGTLVNTAYTSVTDSVARFTAIDGQITGSPVKIDNDGVMTIAVATERALEITTSFGTGASDNLVLIEATNSAWDRPLLRIIDHSTEGGASNIRIDSPNPDIELIESDQTPPAGKFEIAVQGDILQLNGRNAADNSFEVIAGFTRKGAATNPGSLVIGAATGDRPNAMVETVAVSTQGHIMCSTAVGANSGDLFKISGTGAIVINELGTTAVSLRIEGDANANLFITDPTNDRIGIGIATPGKLLHVHGEGRFGTASTITGRIQLGKSTSAGYTILEPSAPGSDVTITFPATTGTVALTSDLANFLSGTYTPTRSAEANMDGNVTMTQAQYMRVGSVVTVSGRFTADPTLTATTTSFEITLPIASNLGAVEDCAGVAFCGNIVSMGAEVIGVVANDTAKIQWKASDVTSQTWSYQFTYEVI